MRALAGARISLARHMTAPPAGRLSRTRVAGRGLRILASVAVAAPRLGRHRAAAAAGLLERLGPTFIKLGQLLGTRVDLIPPDAARALRRLHDRVAPMPASEAAAVVAAARPAGKDRSAGAEYRHLAAQIRRSRPVASGSIGCVYRLRLTDGRAVAVKVRRPRAVRLVPLDLAVLRGLARLAARAPVLPGSPIVEIVEHLAQCVEGQLDFRAEARHLARLRENLAGVDGLVIPQVYDELSGDDVIVMEFLDELAGAAPGRCVDPAARHRAVSTTLRAAYRMLFIDGLVHCDLHPGNLYYLADGRVILLDGGFVVRLRGTAQAQLAQFFAGMFAGDGDACADAVLCTALRLAPGADPARFREQLGDLVRRSAGASAAEFNLAEFTTSLFDLQRRHGLYADAGFVLPLLALLVVEGAVAEYHPEVDFQAEAASYVMHALLTR